MFPVDNLYADRAMEELNQDTDPGKAQVYAILALANELRLLTISVREGGNKIQGATAGLIMEMDKKK